MTGEAELALRFEPGVSSWPLYNSVTQWPARRGGEGGLGVTFDLGTPYPQQRVEPRASSRNVAHEAESVFLPLHGNNHLDTATWVRLNATPSLLLPIRIRTSIQVRNSTPPSAVLPSNPKKQHNSVHKIFGQ